MSAEHELDAAIKELTDNMKQGFQNLFKGDGKMTEWLTTGQMIDKLKVGEMARNDNASNTIFVKKTNTGGIYKCFEDGTARESGYLVSSFVNCKWRILPKYVDFITAMRALKDGKKVIARDIRGYFFEFNEFDKVCEIVDEEMTWGDLINHKWTIED